MNVQVLETELFPADIDVAGREVVAIGDVHGRSDLLAPLVARLDEIASRDAIVVFLGDLVDRGPDSRGCLRIAARGFRDREVHWLYGNHEAMMLAAMNVLVQPSFGRRWHRLWWINGGNRVVEEYGLSDRPPTPQELSSDERRVLESLEMSFRIGNTLFVHAGLSAFCVTETKNGLVFDEEGLDAFLSLHPLEVDDNERHPLWIRHEFLGYFCAFDKGPLVVHGHTPVPRDMAMMQKSYRDARDMRLEGRHLNLDAGSYAYDEVAAAILTDGGYRIVHATARSLCD